jgi:hypothetical protein
MYFVQKAFAFKKEKMKLEYEANRKLLDLKKAAYNGNGFTSANSIMCFDVLWAIEHNTLRPKYQRSKDLREDVALLQEWNRVMKIALKLKETHTE